jgi:hypothetical protein
MGLDGCPTAEYGWPLLGALLIAMTFATLDAEGAARAGTSALTDAAALDGRP